MLPSSRAQPVCFICGVGVGVSLHNKRAWQYDALVCHGPRRTNSDEELVWYEATGSSSLGLGLDHFTLLPSQQPVLVHSTHQICKTLPVRPDCHFLGFHSSCVDIAFRVISTSPTTSLHDFHDLWTTLNQRCLNGPPSEDYWDDVPPIPQKTTEGTCAWFRNAAYYLPTYNYWVWYGSWSCDPIRIPDLTTCLLQNLQSRPKTASGQSSPLQEHLKKLPQELFDLIKGFVQQGPMSIQSTDILPQSLWKEGFLKIPFLWDLDVGEVNRFPDSPPDPDKEWDWEQLVRRLMARPIQTDLPTLGNSVPVPWNYGKVGLRLPQGLANRRRIWQIVEDMDPNELDGWEGEIYGKPK